MNLVIVESPTKANTIAKFLGKDYKLSASFGHIRDLPKSKLGIDIEDNFQPQYVIPAKSKETVSKLKKESQKADQVILATDEDREGEAIAFHLKELLNLKDYQRIVFHEITNQAIKQALKNPRKINMDLVEAQTARRVLDRIVGYKLSPFLWKKVARGLSAGRVQSVAVRLIVEREREIEKFNSKEYWTIEAILKKEKELSALLTAKNDKKIPKLGIKSKKEAEAITKELKEAQFQVEKIEKKEKKKNPLPPFTTSTLQQTAGYLLHLSSQRTMRLAQQLYEKGLISYHRTDSLNLSKEAISAASAFISKEFGKNYLKTRNFKTKSKGAQEAHEAVRPTNPNLTPDKIKNKLYTLIWQRFVASQMQPAVFDSLKMKIKAKNYTFQANGQTLKFDGFTKVYPTQYTENILPELKEKNILELIKLNPEQHFTQPPARYNEPSLIKALESEGIGRPSTYAPIIYTIQRRNYVEKNEQNRFRPTEIGTVVNNLLVEHFPKVVDLKFTAKMEESLDEIAQGQKEWPKVIENFYQPFEKNLKQKEKELSKKEIAEEKTNKKCPNCGANLVIKLGKFGKFYACPNFPKCRYTETLEDNKLNLKCPKCRKGQVVEKRTRRGKLFYGCDQYPDCDFAVWDKPLGDKCPKCGWLLIKTKRGQIKCSNPECDYQA